MTNRITTAIAGALKLSPPRANRAGRELARPANADASHPAPWANDPTMKWIHPSNLVR